MAIVIERFYIIHIHPGEKEELSTESSQQVGNTAWLFYYITYVITIEQEQLELLLIMEMMRIGQSEKQDYSHTEKTTYQIPC